MDKNNRAKATPDGLISVLVRAADGNFLQSPSVHSVIVFQVKCDSGSFLRGGKFCVERDWCGGIHIRDWHGSQQRTMIPVESRDEAAAKQHAKCGGNSELSILQPHGLQWPDNEARVGHSMKFISRSGPEPMCF